MKNNRPLVLIVDDDPGVLFLHEIIVTESKLHPEPKSFFDAEKALHFISEMDQTNQGILIFLDINMPKMNGWEFLDALEKKTSKAEIKVVMVTSSLSKNERIKSKSYERIIDFWEKPIDEEHVAGLMEKFGSWFQN